MKQTPIELFFWPGEGAAVRDLRAMRARPDAPEFVGMRHDPEAGGLVATGEPGRVVVLPQHATLDLAAYAKDVRAGHLVPADKATADRFGVKFVPSESAAPPEAEPDAAASAREGAATTEERQDVQVLEGTLEAAPWSRGDLPHAGPGVVTERREAPGHELPPEGPAPAVEAPPRGPADVGTVEPLGPAAEPKKGRR